MVNQVGLKAVMDGPITQHLMHMNCSEDASSGYG
jgi:hypothetical protein